MRKSCSFGLALLLVATLALTLPGGALALSYVSTQGAALAPLLTTVDDPANHEVTPPSNYDGVAKILATFPSGTYGGSGALLQSGGKMFLLTAAHVVHVGGVTPTTMTATFPGVVGSFSGSQYFFPAGWNGNFQNGHDLAIVKLNAPVPTLAYNILQTDILAATAGDLAGYGRSGTGLTGNTLLPFGTLRQGQNTMGEAFWNMNGFPYAFDFDNGAYNQNTILSLFSIPSDYGLGTNEVMVAPGDSGGPTFIGGQIAGVHSFLATYGMPYDIDNLLNSTFGELGGDTRVAAYADWINATAVPLPGAAYLLGTGLAGLLLWGRRRRLV